MFINFRFFFLVLVTQIIFALVGEDFHSIRDSYWLNAMPTKGEGGNFLDQHFSNI